MALPVFRRFSIADIPNAPNWIANILNPLNTFCEQVVQMFTKSLQIGQNVQGSIYAAQFTTPTNYASGGFPTLTYQYNGGGTPTNLLIGQIATADGSPLLTPVSINSWTLNTNVNPAQINVNYIAGLTASKKYNITLLAL